MDRIPAIVLAGGRNSPEMAAASGSELRALTPVNGRRMMDLVVEALQKARSIGGVTIVGIKGQSDGHRNIADHGGFVENVYAGLEGVTADSALIVTVDIPFLTPDSVDDFVQLGRVESADIVYPIVRVADCYERFPGIKRTAVRLMDGEFTGGNLALVRPPFMQAQRERLTRAYSLRKSPLKLAMMVGLGTTLKLAASIAIRRPLLSIQELEVAISRVVGGKARAVVSRYPEVATDIDRASDLAALAGFRTPREA